MSTKTLEQPMTLAAIVLAEQGFQAALSRLREEFRVQESLLTADINRLNALRHADGQGIDVEKIQAARQIIRMVGRFADVGDRRTMVSDAMTDIAKGGDKIRTRYFGCKDYDRWSSQREDHPYGYGPRHGSIVFRIEKATDPGDWTSEQIEAALYVLQSMLDGKDVSLA